jgi:hypothetical protein
VFESLVAYVGEVIRRKVNGRWKVHPTAKGAACEPTIIDSLGNEYAPFMIVSKALDEPVFSIAGATEGELASRVEGLGTVKVPPP